MTHVDSPYKKISLPHREQPSQRPLHEQVLQSTQFSEHKLSFGMSNPTTEDTFSASPYLGEKTTIWNEMRATSKMALSLSPDETSAIRSPIEESVVSSKSSTCRSQMGDQNTPASNALDNIIEQPEKYFDFLGLPPEIRNTIYRLVLVQPSIIELRDVWRGELSRPNQSGFWKQPPMLLSCLQIRFEALEMYFVENVFRRNWVLDLRWLKDCTAKRSDPSKFRMLHALIQQFALRSASGYFEAYNVARLAYGIEKYAAKYHRYLGAKAKWVASSEDEAFVGIEYPEPDDLTTNQKSLGVVIRSSSRIITFARTMLKKISGTLDLISTEFEYRRIVNRKIATFKEATSKGASIEDL